MAKCMVYINQSKFPAMFVMMLYFEPQILYGMTGPKIAEMSGLILSVEDRYCTAVLTHPASRRVYKMASHGGAGHFEMKKQLFNRATAF